MFEFLAKLSFTKGTSITIIAFGLLIAPFNFMFQFYPEIIQKHDPIKLILICIGIGMPASILQFAALLWRLEEEKEEDAKHQTSYDEKEINSDWKEKVEADRLFKYMAMATLFYGIGLYFPCGIRFFDPNLSTKDAIGLAIASNLGSMTIVLLPAVKAQIFRPIKQWLRSSFWKKRTH